MHIDTEICRNSPETGLADGPKGAPEEQLEVSSMRTCGSGCVRSDNSVFNYMRMRHLQEPYGCYGVKGRALVTMPIDKRRMFG